jgi:hypothetical protein
VFIIYFLTYFVYQIFLRDKWARLVLLDICYKYTYRLTPDIIDSKTTSIRCLLLAIQKIWKYRDLKIDRQYDIVAFDAFEKDFSDRMYYLKGISNVKFTTNFVFRGNLANALLFYEKIFLSFTSFFLCFVSFFYNICKKNNKLSLFILENIEMFLIIKYLKVNRISSLYIFNSYEKDISYICYACRYFNIRTELFPSSNPIKLFHKTVIASKFYFCAPYQKKEAETLKRTWLVDEFSMIPPMDFNKIVTHNQYIKYKYKIGILSSSMSFRQTLGYPIGNVQELFAEREFQSVVKELLEENFLFPKDIVIYLHPKEKESKGGILKVRQYYNSIFGFDFDFAPLSSPSREYFYLSEIGLGTISTSLMERLYGGYKTLFSSFGFLDGIYSDSRLDVISASSKDHLKRLIKDSIAMNESSFFTKYDLWDYHYSSYDNIIR